MPRFSSPASQAGHVMRAVQGSVLRSVGTVRNYEAALTRVAEWAKSEKGHLVAPCRSYLLRVAGFGIEVFS